MKYAKNRIPIIVFKGFPPNIFEISKISDVGNLFKSKYIIKDINIAIILTYIMLSIDAEFVLEIIDFVIFKIA